jgi:predicted MPP superfamily phosphohydrolase
VLKIIQQGEAKDMTKQVVKNELKKAPTAGQISNTDFLLLEDDWHNKQIYYITDIHLEHHVPKNAIEAFRKDPKPFIIRYIRNLLGIPEEVVEISKKYSYLLIGGDVADSFELVKAFFEVLCEYWFNHRIVVILGNHELWNCVGDTTDDKFQNYRQLFQSLEIYFLQNDLMLSRGFKMQGYSEKFLQNVEESKLRNLCVRLPIIILGGVGFSGLNSNYNADNILYGDTITTHEQDIEETSRFFSIYKRLNEMIGDLPVIVLTHTPFSDWSDIPYNKNWIYVNGHNHKNYMVREDEKTVYSDNQVGYYDENPKLKYFTFSDLSDIFLDYKDGIYEISIEDYMYFNRCLGIHMAQFKRKGKIHMVKSSGLYMFFYENDAYRKGFLYILNGGVIKTTRHQDLNYFLENMPQYAQTIEKALSPYYNALKHISDSVKEFGGDGTIHGAIVDIDFFDHIYLNPLDGKVTPYYATDIKHKYNYDNVASLLKNNNQELYLNFKTLTSNENPLVVYNQDGGSDSEPTFVAETDIYKMSRVIKSLQYISKAKVIRLWNEELLASLSNLENHNPLSLQDSITE